MDREQHWEKVYRSRRADEVSWFQPHAVESVRLIESALPDRDSPILDVGGGASTLVDDLLKEGYRHVTVLDVSPSALAVVRERLGTEAVGVSLRVGDILSADLPRASVALWHDRAVFHFLTDPADRDRYLDQVRRCLVPGGLVVIATFAQDGPVRCSGLDVVRYSAEDLEAVFGPDFELLEGGRHGHRTPGGTVQAFTCCLFRYSPG